MPSATLLSRLVAEIIAGFAKSGLAMHPHPDFVEHQGSPAPAPFPGQDEPACPEPAGGEDRDPRGNAAFRVRAP